MSVLRLKEKQETRMGILAPKIWQSMFFSSTHLLREGKEEERREFSTVFNPPKGEVNRPQSTSLPAPLQTSPVKSTVKY